MKYEGHTPWVIAKDSKRCLNFIQVTEKDIVITARDEFQTFGFICIVNSEYPEFAKLIADAPLLAEQNEKMLAMLKRFDKTLTRNKAKISDIIKLADLIAEVETRT
jgi:hypothetical protein